jgi:hypothetical protein
MAKKYYFGAQKDGKNPSDLKIGIWGPKSVLSCDTSIDWEFYMEQEKIYLWGQKCEISLQSPNTKFECAIFNFLATLHYFKCFII